MDTYNIALQIVTDYVKEHMDVSDSDVDFHSYVVWFCYILGGWKALIATSIPDGTYYEVTFNSQKNEAYLDAYKKFDNRCIQDILDK